MIFFNAIDTFILLFIYILLLFNFQKQTTCLVINSNLNLEEHSIHSNYQQQQQQHNQQEHTTKSTYSVSSTNIIKSNNNNNNNIAYLPSKKLIVRLKNLFSNILLSINNKTKRFYKSQSKAKYSKEEFNSIDHDYYSYYNNHHHHNSNQNSNSNEHRLDYNYYQDEDDDDDNNNNNADDANYEDVLRTRHKRENFNSQLKLLNNSNNSSLKNYFKKSNFFNRNYLAEDNLNISYNSEFFYLSPESNMSFVSSIENGTLGLFDNVFRGKFKNSGGFISENLTSELIISFLSKLAIGFLLYLLTIWTIIGNIFVCVALFTNKQLKQGGMSNYLIGNLALSDLLLGLTVLPFSATFSTFKTWIFGEILCDLWLSIDVLCSTASIWGLLAISLDRYIATNHPIRYRKQKNSIRTAITYCTISWLISIMISLGPLIFKSSTTSALPEISLNNKTSDSDLHKSSTNLNDNKKSGLRRIENTTDYECVLFQTSSFVILSSLGSFYLPLFLMIVLYTGVFLRIRQQSKMFHNNREKKKQLLQRHNSKKNTEDLELIEKAKLTKKESSIKLLSSSMTENRSSDTQVVVVESNSIQNPKVSIVTTVSTDLKDNKDNIREKILKKKRALLKRASSTQMNSSEARVTKTLAIIMGCFVACWLPFFVIYIIRSQLADPDSISGNLMDVFIWLGYFNSALNPILYAILNANFRTAFKDILTCCCCLRFLKCTNTSSNFNCNNINNNNNNNTPNLVRAKLTHQQSIQKPQAKIVGFSKLNNNACRLST